MTPEHLTEAAASIRVMTEIRELTTDDNRATLVVKGSEEQVGLAEWVFTQLTRPRMLPEEDRYTALPEYVYDVGEADNLVRAAYLNPRLTIPEFQEIATATRTLTDIRRVYAYSGSRLLLMRGDRGKLDLATWMLAQLDGPEAAVRRDPPWPAFELELVDPQARRASTSEEVAVRVFHLDPRLSIQQFQQQATMLRAIAQIRRVYTYNLRHSVAVRDTPARIELAEWLLEQSRNRGNGELQPPSELRRIEGASDDLVRVYYVPPVPDGGDLAEFASRFIDRTGLSHVFLHPTLGILAARGTLDQLQKAEGLLPIPEAH